LSDRFLERRHLERIGLAPLRAFAHTGQSVRPSFTVDWLTGELVVMIKLAKAAVARSAELGRLVVQRSAWAALGPSLVGKRLFSAFRAYGARHGRARGQNILVIASLVFASAAQAQTWSPNPGVAQTPTAGSFDYNNADNWNPVGVPGNNVLGNTATATFGTTTVPNGSNVGFSAGRTDVGGWTFNSGAPNYTFTLQNAPGFTQDLEFTGMGIVANGGIVAINMNTNGVGFSHLGFNNDATAGSARINNASENVVFIDNSNGGTAVITLSNRGGALFSDTASAANATITNNGTASVIFLGSSTAGSATINLNSGFLFFNGSATGGNAAINNFSSDGWVDFSNTTGPFGPSGAANLTVGSLNGSGLFFLGANELTVGSNNLNTTVSGVISDCGPTGSDCLGNALGTTGGSLIKVGTGTLTLSGANTYTGGTTVSDGTLLLSGSGTLGSITGKTTVTGGMLDLGGTSQTQNGGLTLTGGIIQNGTLSSSGLFDMQAGTVSAALAGTGELTKSTAGTVTLSGANTYTGVTTISGGTLAAGATNTFSAASHMIVGSSSTLALQGFNQTLNNGLENAGTVELGIPGVTAPGTTLTVAGNYVGEGGTLVLNTFLGSDGSPSDKLIINGGTADPSLIRIINVGGPGAQTTANGILVVQAINGATTATNAFTLGGVEVRGGAYDYDLFRGSPSNIADPTVANDWFLRSTFLGNGGGDGGPVTPPDVLPPVPPPDSGVPPPPGVYPIIGPELATYGVVQPIARQMGMTTLGTYHERVGDAAADAACLNGSSAAFDADLPTKAAPVPYANCRPAVWGRLFGQQIDDHYQAFADPRASGQIAGIQTGVDVWRGSLIPGQSDTAGLYFAYSNGNVSVDGLVTNAAATAYILEHTGSLNLNAYSVGGYWTHIGPGGWYVDAVLQGSFYQGNASTQFASLPTNGSGFTSSLETGYPIPLPWFGTRFVLEPEGQIIWQRVSFDDAFDGLGPVGLGTTSGASGRLGLRGKWTINDPAGRVWQPYLLANVWRDWDGNATTMFGIDQVPLLEQATRLEFAAGLSAKILPGLSLYAQAGYQIAVSGSTDGGRRDGVKGDFGAHWRW
jgi:outer membrane autotransporter protein